MPTIDVSQINWLAVLTAAVATFLLGGLWYTALFGKAWQKAHRFTDEQSREIQKQKPPPLFFGGMLVCYFVMAVAVALIAQASGVESTSGGAMVGFLMFLAAAAVGFTNHLPTQVTLPGWLIDTVYQLIYLVGSGAIIGAWQ